MLYAGSYLILPPYGGDAFPCHSSRWGVIRSADRRFLKNANLLMWLILLAPWGCPAVKDRPDSSEGTEKPDLISTIKVVEGAGLLFTFFDRRAEQVTVEKRAQVEPAARAEVMVTNPRRLLAGNLIYLADLRKARKDGTFRSWVSEHGAWLDRVTPKKSVLDKPVAALAKAAKAPAPKEKRKKRVRKRPRKRKSTRERDEKSTRVRAKGDESTRERAKGDESTRVSSPRVILFSTQWCPACRQAREYFTAKKIPFLELNIQKDPEAAQHYVKLQQRYGFRRGTVPVLVINGRVMAGFSRQQVDAALASPPPD